MILLIIMLYLIGVDVKLSILLFQIEEFNKLQIEGFDKLQIEEFNKLQIEEFIKRLQEAALWPYYRVKQLIIIIKGN